MFLRRGIIVTGAALLVAAGCSRAVETNPAPHGVYGSSPSTPNAAYEGVVTRVDAPQRVIVMSDGRMYQVPADSMVYVNGQPVAYTTVPPGSRVVLNNGQLVELRDGRYVVVQQPTAVAVPGYRQTIQGTVTDVDRNEIKIRTPKESFEIPMRDANTTTIRKGDNVTIDLTFTPASPAALPR
jgi:hypothetical protein